MKKPMGRVLIVAAILVVFAIAGRIYLPYWLKEYVNSTLDSIPGHTGSVADIQVHLYRGAYVIKNLVIEKTEGPQKVPFITIENADLSIEWKALFDGAVVAQVHFDKPIVHFVGSKAASASSKQLGDDVDWTEPLEKLLPIRINRFTASDGILFYHDFTSKPQVDLSLNQLEVLLTNLTNSKSSAERLPSSLTATAVSLGDGKLTVRSKLNVLRKIPDIDLDLKFEQVNLPALNDFLRAYANVDAEAGTFFLYSEIVVKEGQLSGYVKPILTDVRLLDWGEGKGDLLQNIWETLVATVTEIFENQPKDQLATKVPLQGDLNEPETAILPAIWNVFLNAFVEAFTKNIDGTVKFSAESQ